MTSSSPQEDIPLSLFGAFQVQACPKIGLMQKSRVPGLMGFRIFSRGFLGFIRVLGVNGAKGLWVYWSQDLRALYST